MATEPLGIVGIDVIGIGSAIVDIMARVDDNFLSAENLSKGAMALIDQARVQELHQLLDSPIESSGGSVANTMAGVASFGGNSGFVGKVSNDRFGTLFTEDMERSGVQILGPTVNSETATAVSIVLVTPDAQRTLNTCLGVAIELSADDVKADTFSNTRYVLCEAYLLDAPAARKAALAAVEHAKKAGARLVMTLSDSLCVDRHRHDLLNLVADPTCIVFANEEELKSLYQTDLEQAIKQLATQTELAFITHGSQGSTVVAGGETFEIEPFSYGEVVDTTGAGDQYAAGVLFGLASDYSPDKAAKLGSIAAAEVISQIGARPHRPLIELIALLEEPTRHWPNSSDGPE